MDIHKNEKQKVFLTDVEAAQFLGLGTPTLRNWRHLGKGPRYAKFGRAIRYCIADLEEWAASHLVEPRHSKERRIAPKC